MEIKSDGYEDGETEAVTMLESEATETGIKLEAATMLSTDSRAVQIGKTEVIIGMRAAIDLD